MREEEKEEEEVASVADNNKTEFKVDATRVWSAIIYFHFDFATTIPLVHVGMHAHCKYRQESDGRQTVQCARIATVVTTPQIRCSAKHRNMLIPYVRNTQMTSMRRQPNKYLKFFSQMQLHSMNV